MRMNKKKEIVPKLRFPEFKNNEFWLYDFLGCLSTVLRGGSPRPIDEYLTSDTNSMNWLKIGDINKEDKYITKTSERVKKQALDKTRVVHSGDLIMSNSMSFGRPYLLKISTCIHDGWIALTEINSNINKEYLYYYILSDISQIYFMQSAAGGGIKNLNAEIIKKLIVLYPEDIIEQQKIADCLSSIDELIDAESRKLKALEKYKKGLMQKLFPVEGKTLPEWRFPEFRGKNEWRIKPLGKICTNYDSRRIPITEKDRVRGEIPYIGASGVIDYINDFIFDEDLLCVSEDGANLVARIYPIAFSISGKTWVNNHAHVLKFSHKYTQNIVESYLNMINLQDFLTGMAQPKLNRAKLDIIPIPLPEEEEQQKIAGCLSEVDTMIEEQSNKVEQLKAHKKGLMQGFFPSLEEADV